MPEDCRLCTALSNEGSQRPENYILLKSKHFAVMPTLGQLVEGWVMVVSFKHKKSIRYHTSEELLDLNNILKRTVNAVQNIYGPTLIFEHGPSDITMLHGGCCISHTHIHVVPFRFRNNFLSNIPFNSNLCCSIEELPSIIAPESSYLLVGFGENLTMLNLYPVNEPLPRQFLRRVLAFTIGNNDSWDWRQFHFMENVLRTIAKISQTLLPYIKELS